MIKPSVYVIILGLQRRLKTVDFGLDNSSYHAQTIGLKIHNQDRVSIHTKIVATFDVEHLILEATNVGCICPPPPLSSNIMRGITPPDHTHTH